MKRRGLTLTVIVTVTLRGVQKYNSAVVIVDYNQLLLYLDMPNNSAFVFWGDDID